MTSDNETREGAEATEEGQGSVPPESRPQGSTQDDAAKSAEAPASEGVEAELARTRDRLLRTAADFDNYRKRARRDISDAERRVQEDLLKALLPTFDNLERAAGHAESSPDVKALAEGLQMVIRQFQDTLAGLGIERVAATGKPFDPAEHEAVQHVQTDEVPPGAVVRELQGGYRWQGRLLRPALVVVSKAQPPAAAPASSDGAG